jgi:hypothetical protein
LILAGLFFHLSYSSGIERILMEVPSLHGLGLEHGILTKEKQKEVDAKSNSIRIGLPKESSNEERRVSISPSGVAVLSDSRKRSG